MRYILASASPRRKELLEKTGIPFEIIPSSVNEKICAISIFCIVFIIWVVSFSSVKFSEFIETNFLMPFGLIPYILLLFIYSILNTVSSF